jgi:DNA-binding HxlR family transcriptional regulator
MENEFATAYAGANSSTATNPNRGEEKLMSAKESLAIGQLLSLLESRYAIRVMWALRDGHAQTFRLLQDSVGGITPNTLNTRIKELREAGLLTHGSEGYAVTTMGADLLKRLGDLQAFAGKWATSQAKKAI